VNGEDEGFKRRRSMKLRLAGMLSLLCLFPLSLVYGEGFPYVEVFSPQGTVKKVRQVAVRFSEQIVPFGDPRGIVEPFDIDCSERGTGRWADGKNWVYDFEKDLSAGIRCEFKLKPGVKSLSGEEVLGGRDFSFSTGGPSIVEGAYPHEGRQNIDEEQIFILVLDGDPDVESVIQSAFFSIAGIQGPIGIRVVGGKEREEILKAHFKKDAPPHLILIQCRQRFPSDTMVSLVWGKGIRSKTGLSTEQDQILRFQTRKAFSVAFHCERENPKAGCIPILPMTLQFTAPVSRDMASQILARGPEGKIWRPDLKPEKERPILYNVAIQPPFPAESNFTVELPAGLQDDAGRQAVNADKFPLAVRTDQFPPLAKFAARFGIIEWKNDPVLPVTLRNVEPRVKARMKKVDQEEGITGKVIGRLFNLTPQKTDEVQAWLKRVASASRESSVFGKERGIREFNVPKPAGAKAFEVVGIPLKDPGFYVVELESTILGTSLLGSPRPMYVPTAVLVTNLSVHFKRGRESSLVWVTTLDTGEPVKEVEVIVKDCRDKVLWKGRTDNFGIARIDESLPPDRELPRCDQDNRYHPYRETGGLDGLGGGLFITARTSDDFAFVHSSWDDGIERWRFQLPEEAYSGPYAVHTIFDRALFRAGETVHMKHIFLQHTVKGFSIPDRDHLPNLVQIEHYGSEEKYEFPLKWDEHGISETTWTIPKEAKLGTYGVVLTQGSKSRKGRISYDGGGWTSGGFRVEEFRVPLMKGMIQPPAEPLITPKEVPLDLAVQYLAGGGAGFLPVRLRSEVKPRPVPSFEGFDTFIFGNGPVKEGVVRRGQALEWEDGEGEEGQERGEGTVDKKVKRLQGVDLVLDRSGTGRTTVAGFARVESPEELLTEIEFRDPNGEIQTVSSKIPLWPSKYLVGIKPDSWAVSKDALKFHVAVVDLSGKPMKDAPVKADLFERKTYTHRKRLVGGFYAYEHTVETKRIATLCEGRTDGKGLLICEAKSPISGNVILEAQSLDDSGNRTVVHQDVWVAGKSDWWFEVGDHDRIDLLPEKKRYQPGETAVFQVRMPFRSATALVSVEREGVMETWVKRVSGQQPVVEVPIKGNYAPNVFVSVLVVRGRLPWIKPTAMIDLGKPAYKLGVAEIQVGWKSHELKVDVTADRKVYKVREKAWVRVKVTAPDGKALPTGSEVAVAAVDEGLLELKANGSWEILAAMMGRRGYSVQTSTAQMQVIGKRHFGLKALPQGGGGGRQTTRELFDTLLLWKGRLMLDGKGEASVEVPLNDSITSFKIVAVATGGPGLFGAGSTSIQSTQDLMILSGLPPLVREGDRFEGEFTLRNTTGRPIEVDISGKVEELPGTLYSMAVLLLPGEAKVVGWKTVVPVGVDGLRWEVEAKEKDGSGMDRLKMAQRVVQTVPDRTFQATITQIENDARLSVQRPEDALPERGGVNISLRPRITDGLNSVVEYMKNYPYTCMEQKLSVAVALRNEYLWKRWMSDLPSHLDSDGLVKYFPPCQYGDPVLTSYILAIGHEAGWSVPDGIREKMESSLIKFVEGSLVRYSPIPTADLSIKKLSALEALSRTGKAGAALLGSISIEPNLWPTSALIDWLNILQNMRDIPNREQRRNEAEQILRSRLDFQGTTMGFSTEGTDCLWWLMVSNDVNAVRAILALLPSSSWREDMPRLVQGALARQKRGAWDLTLANAWGVLAVEKFSRAFENTPVSGSSRASLGGQSQSIDWNNTPKGKTTRFAWPKGAESLTVSHHGTGKPWMTVQGIAAIPLKEPLSSGYKIKKTITSVERKKSEHWSRGDILRVRLDLEAQADQTWVVVNDPIPAGATILGKGLARGSDLLTQGEIRKGWVWPAFEERSFEAFRAYYEYVPKGRWTVEYTIRLNQSGTFQLPTTRAEALYFPEMFGENPNKNVEVQP
jgi:alpha-2-macroglobulin